MNCAAPARIRPDDTKSAGDYLHDILSLAVFNVEKNLAHDAPPRKVTALNCGADASNDYDSGPACPFRLVS